MVTSVVFATLAAFNLVCAGTGSERQTEGGPVRQSKFEVTLRADLDSKRWCYEPCASTYPIALITEREIKLDNTEGKTYWTVQIIDRETGRYLFMQRAGGSNIIQNGTCEWQAFTGFPEFKF